jgi:diacylglycerol kinase family enzyme
VCAPCAPPSTDRAERARTNASRSSSPTARRLDDGLFEVYLFARASRASLVRIGLAGAFARLPAGVATLLRASRVTIESDEPVPVQLDGDAAGSTPARLEVDATRTRLLVPWMELERPPR